MFVFVLVVFLNCALNLLMEGWIVEWFREIHKRCSFITTELGKFNKTFLFVFFLSRKDWNIWITVILFLVQRWILCDPMWKFENIKIINYLKHVDVHIITKDSPTFGRIPKDINESEMIKAQNSTLKNGKIC